MNRLAALALAFVLLLLPRVARADDSSAAPADAGTSPAPVADDPKEDLDTSKSVVGPDSPERKQDIEPVRAEPPVSTKIRFTADPVGDGATIALGATFGLLSSFILSTDEIRPQQIAPNFKTSQLLWIDRGAARQSLDEGSNMRSNFGLWAAMGYVAVDTVLDGFREGRSAAIVDGIMYAEAFFLTQGITNVAKIAFRRPRPRAYIQRDAYLRAGGDPLTYDNASVDSSLSFFSGHTSQAAAMSAAATYIAFSRSPGSPRAWLTLLGGVAVTSFVGIERVRSGAHFPTDVIAGATVGAGVGALVVHMHREDTVKQRPVWIGAAPTLQGGMVTASGLF